MCGIGAVFSKRVTQKVTNIKVLCDLIAHRGPDDEGYSLFFNDRVQCYGGSATPQEAYNSSLVYAPNQKWSDSIAAGRAALGHRRLSIIDLSVAGHQPMATSDGRFWITYNGEIYNQDALMQELEGSFVSSTDTELLLAAYVKWGERVLDKLNGMFSFVIYDRKTHHVFAARDRFGIKPLYYYYCAGTLYFVSEIKQLMALPEWQAKLDHQMAYDYLRWEYTDHTEKTLFSGVKQVRGGEVMSFSLDQLDAEPKPKRWYRLPEDRFSGSFEEAAEQFRLILSDAVDLRLRADVSVGSCLSGGLDSSSIVCLLNRQLGEGNRNQKTFSACSVHKRYDERAYAEAVVAATNVMGHFIYPTSDELLNNLERLVYHQDEPFGSTSIFAQWKVFQAAYDQGVKVMLDGQGADEFFGGYYSLFPFHLGEMLKKGCIRKFVSEFHQMYTQHGVSARGLLKQSIAFSLVPSPLFQGVRRFRDRFLRGSNIDVRGFDVRCGHPTPHLFGLKNSQQTWCEYNINALSLPRILRWEDRSSMAHSIEARTPFLDYRLAEFAYSLPADFRFKKGETKRVMREGMKGILPEGIRSRTDKMGFVTPEEIWIKEHPEKFVRLVNESVTASKGLISSDMGEVVAQIVSGRRPYTQEIWRYINFGLWVRRFCVEID